MPQEQHILQCFSCHTFQVDIVKKVPKWCCKVCGEKQSLKQIFGKGSGKECRELVQKLNENRIKQLQTQKLDNKAELETSQKFSFNIVNNSEFRGKSKWSEYLENAQSSSLANNRLDNHKTEENIFENSNQDLNTILNLSL